MVTHIMDANPWFQLHDCLVLPLSGLYLSNLVGVQVLPESWQSQSFEILSRFQETRQCRQYLELEVAHS